MDIQKAWYRLSIRVAAAVTLAVAFTVSQTQGAMAHTGESVPLSHVILESVRWGLALAAVLAVIVLSLWLRMKLRGRE